MPYAREDIRPGMFMTGPSMPAITKGVPTQGQFMVGGPPLQKSRPNHVSEVSPDLLQRIKRLKQGIADWKARYGKRA
jgi:hypothetical protein